MTPFKNLSHHFLLSEFLNSDTARRKNITLNPTLNQINNMKKLCTNLLEPIRVAIGNPIIINSGYRNKVLNHFVKGAANSYHMQGRAADIVAVTLSIPHLANVIDALIARGDIKPTEYIVHTNYIHLAL